MATSEFGTSLHFARLRNLVAIGGTAGIQVQQMPTRVRAAERAVRFWLLHARLEK